MRALPKSLNILLGRGLLALVLLFGQQHAALHWLSHAVEATQAKASAPATDLQCDDCLAVAGLGAAATASGPLLPEPFAQHALASPLPTADASAALRLAFRSRAPPILS
jgi:hypothetical protein